MNQSQSIQTLEDLLSLSKSNPEALFVSLSCRSENNTYLLDKTVAKVTAQVPQKIEYYQLGSQASKLIQSELKLSHNPILLLLKAGKIKAIFNGIVPRFELATALQQLYTS